MLRGGQLTEGDPEMVGIVKGVEQIFVERVDILKTRETVKDGRELLGKGLCGVFDLANVEGYHASDLNPLFVSIYTYLGFWKLRNLL